MINRLRDDRRGAVALMTLVFMTIVGAVSILFLWSLAYVTGAYNTLYIANQNAAIAAASTPGEPIAGGQLAYQCSPVLTPGDLICEGSHSAGFGGNYPPIQAAALVIENSLKEKPFGLSFDGADRNVYMPNPGLLRAGLGFDELRSDLNSLEIFNVQRSSGEIKAMIAAGGRCQIPTNGSRGSISPNYSGDQPGALHCWKLNEPGLEDLPKQYTSGVITRTMAEVSLIPTCDLAFCKTTILVSAAAAQQQLAAPGSYEDYPYP